MNTLTNEEKILADKVNFVIEHFCNGAEKVKNKLGIGIGVINRWRRKDGQTTPMAKVYQEAFEKHFNIPLSIWEKNVPFHIDSFKQHIEKEQEKENCLYDKSSQLTLKSGKSSIVGRRKELEEIERLLESNPTLLITSIGGIGKSTLVNEYLHLKKNQFNYHGFFEGIESFVIELKESLQLNSEKTDELFREAIIKLQKLKGSKLLIFDNIKNIDKRKNELNTILELQRYGYKILLTSREEIKDIPSYRLTTLTKSDAKLFFNSIYIIEDEVLLENILNHLDYHALFIELTAKALQNKSTLTPLKIKERFNKGEFPRVSIKRKESFHDYLDKLFSFKALDSEEILIMKKLSALPSIKINFNFLKKLLNIKDEENFEEILNYLAEKGWLNREENNYKLHQIIKEYILDFHLPQYQEITEIVNFFIQETLNSVDSQVAINNQSNSIYFQSLYKIIEKINIQNTQVSLLFTHIGNIYYFITPNRAKPFYIKALEIREELYGTYHLETASSYYSLALFYESQAQYGKAKELYLKALNINKQLFGEEHISLSSIYNGLAELYHRDKNYGKAEKLYLKALEISEKKLGLKHPETATSYNNIANLYLSMNLYEKAILYFSKDLKITTEVLGENHLSTAISYHNFARLCGELEQYSQAKKYYQRALNIKMKILGKHHLSTLSTSKDLALLYSVMQQPNKAYPLLEKITKIYETILPHNHYDLIESKKSLDIIKQLQKKGNSNE